MFNSGFHCKNARDRSGVEKTLAIGYLLLKNEKGRPLYTIREIAEMVGVPKSTIHLWKCAAREEGLLDENIRVRTKIQKISEIASTNRRQGRCGPKRITSIRADRIIYKTIFRNRDKTQDELLMLINKFYNIKICKNTLVRRMREMGIKSYKKTKKFMLTKPMVRKRMAWAREMKRKMTQRMWNNVAWSDESMVQWNLSYAERCYRTKDESLAQGCVDNRVKHPMQVMVWGIINARGVGALTFVEGYMNSEKYCETIEKIVHPQLKKWFGRSNSYHFMHDLAPCHNSKMSRAKLAKLKIRMFRWPSNAPDMNPIENVWRFMKIETRKLLRDAEFRGKYSGLSQMELLKRAISTAWASPRIKRVAQNCCKSMSRRVDALIRAHGFWTKY